MVLFTNRAPPHSTRNRCLLYSPHDTQLTCGGGGETSISYIEYNVGACVKHNKNQPKIRRNQQHCVYTTLLVLHRITVPRNIYVLYIVGWLSSVCLYECASRISFLDKSTIIKTSRKSFSTNIITLPPIESTAFTIHRNQNTSTSHVYSFRIIWLGGTGGRLVAYIASTSLFKILHIKIQQFIFRYTFMDNNIFWTHITYKNYLSLSVLALMEGGLGTAGLWAKYWEGCACGNVIYIYKVVSVLLEIRTRRRRADGEMVKP